jgi:outer membrane protein assembly factor BamB
LWSSSLLKKQDRFSKLIPFVASDKIYAADHAGIVAALSRENGKTIWKSNTHQKLTAGPTLVDNQLVVATKDAKVLALDSTTGHVLWEKKVASEVLAPPAGGKGVILVHSIDGSVTALAAKDGEIKWNATQSTPSLTLRYTSSPVVHGDVALVGLSTGKLLAFNIQNGMVEWERTITLPRGRSELQRMVDISADPIVDGDNVYAITYQGKLAAVSLSTGNLLWERDVSSYHNMGIDKNNLYITDNQYQLWAIDRASGATAWKQDKLAQRFITGPCTVNNAVVVADRGGYLHMISPTDGHLLGRFEAKGKFYQGPQTMGHEVLVANNSGKLAAIHLPMQSKKG